MTPDTGIGLGRLKSTKLGESGMSDGTPKLLNMGGRDEIKQV